MVDNLILSDVDGVCLSWEEHFHKWMQSRGHKRARGEDSYMQEHQYPHLSVDKAREMVYYFNTSVWLLNLPAFRDARSGIAKLAEHGYKFHFITAMGTDEYALEARRINLQNVFGADVIHDLTATSMYEPDSKLKPLSQYKDSGLYWIEDHPDNCELGIRLGLNGILMDHTHNRNYTGSALRVDDWSQICNHILSN